MFVSVNVRFYEDDYLRNMKFRSWLVLEKLLGERCSTHLRETVSHPVVRETQTEAEPMEPHNSGRVVKRPDRYDIYDIHPSLIYRMAFLFPTWGYG